MKDHNGGDIPGTVLESINASERQETGFMSTFFNGYNPDKPNIKWDNSDKCYSKAINAPALGITSQETLETKVL